MKAGFLLTSNHAAQRSSYEKPTISSSKSNEAKSATKAAIRKETPKTGFKKGFLNPEKKNGTNNNPTEVSSTPTTRDGFQKGFLNKKTSDPKKVQSTPDVPLKHASPVEKKDRKGGFQKGFLESSSSKPKKKEEEESSTISSKTTKREFLEFNGGELSTKTSATNPLLFLNENQLAIQERKENESLVSPLISIVDSADDGSSQHEESSTSNGIGKPMLIETIHEEVVLEEYQSKNILPPELDGKAVVRKADDNNEGYVMSQLNDSKASSTRTTHRNFIDLQRQWQGINHGIDQGKYFDTLSAFVNTLEHGEMVHVWQWIFDDCSSNKNGALVAGQALFERDPQVMAGFLRSNETKEDKMNALLAIEWLNACLDNSVAGEKGGVLVDGWTECLSCLVELAASTPRRTNLTYSSFKLGLNWITKLAERLLEKHEYDSVVVGSLLSYLDGFLEVFRQWNESKPLAILLYKEWKELSAQASSGNLLPVESLHHLVGSRVAITNGENIHNVGGILHTLAKTSVRPNWTTSNALEALETSCQDHPKYAYSVYRSILRGLVVVCDAKENKENGLKSTTGQEGDNCCAIGNALLRILPSLSHSTTCLSVLLGIITTMNIEQEALTENLLDIVKSRSSSKSPIDESVTLSIISILNNATEEKLQKIFLVLVEESAEPTCHDVFSDWLSTAIFPMWSKHIADNISSDETLSKAMTTIAKVMFELPSSNLCLIAFGTLVETISECSTLNHCFNDRIASGTSAFIGCCIAQLDRTLKSDLDGNENSLFHRLAPLFLLRRLPGLFYHTLLHADGHEELLASLADRMAIRLDIPDNLSKNHRITVKFSPDERRLSAEIAGRALPLDTTEYRCVHDLRLSLSDRFCRPIFRTALERISSFPSVPVDDAIDSLRQARAVLYAVCHHLAVDESGDRHGSSYFFVASFVLKILLIEINDKNKSLFDELTQIQTGCIEFLAGCIDKTIVLSLSSGCANRKACSISRYSSSVIQEVVLTCTDILRHGKSNKQWLISANNELGILPEGKNITFSLPCLICIWNALILVSKRSPTEQERLDHFVASNAEWILVWLQTDSVNKMVGSTRHPSCVAAAIQVVFLLLTRLQTLNFLATHNMNLAIAVKSLFTWAIQTARKSMEYAGVQAATLKLLLTILTIDQSSNDNSFLGAEDIRRFLQLLNDLQKTSHDSTVKELSAQMMWNLTSDS